MPGVKGMKRKKAPKGTDRAKAWTSIRIFRRFDINDLIRTSGAGRNNLQRYLRQLRIHKIIAQIGEFRGGPPGVVKQYRLVRDLGPNHPIRCELCGQALTAKECRPQEEKRSEEMKNDAS